MCCQLLQKQTNDVSVACYCPASATTGTVLSAWWLMLLLLFIVPPAVAAAVVAGLIWKKKKANEQRHVQPVTSNQPQPANRTSAYITTSNN